MLDEVKDGVGLRQPPAAKLLAVPRQLAESPGVMNHGIILRILFSAISSSSHYLAPQQFPLSGHQPDESERVSNALIRSEMHCDGTVADAIQPPSRHGSGCPASSASVLVSKHLIFGHLYSV